MRIITQAILMLTFFITNAWPITFLRVSMQDEIQKADKVVIGQIVNKNVVYSANNPKKRCGWNIHFEVDREFKGGIEDFSFFTTDQDTFFEEADQYLIIANKNDRHDKKGRQGTIFCSPYAGMMGASTANNDYVNISTYEYMANSFWDNGKVAIMPIDTLAAADYGGHWVRVPGHYKIVTSVSRKEINIGRGYHGLGTFDLIFLLNLDELLEEAFGNSGSD